jgi:hypothetical protein
MIRLPGYSHHIGVGESVQQQLSELTNGSGSTNGSNNGVHGTGTAPGPSSGSTTNSGNDETVYVQTYDDDPNYHSLPDPGSHPGYVENSPEFYSSTLMSDKNFQQAANFMNKSFGRSKFVPYICIFKIRRLVDMLHESKYSITGKWI